MENSDVDQILSALKDRSDIDYTSVDVIDPARITASRRALREEIRTILERAGPVVRHIDDVFKKHQADLKSDVAARQAWLAQTLAGFDETFQQGAQHRRLAIEALVGQGVLQAVPTAVAAPYLIWGKPLEMLVDSQVQPWNSWAKVKGHRTTSGSERLSFFFLWQNPSDEHYALVNLAASLQVKGYCQAVGNTGILSGGHAELLVREQLHMFAWQNQPPRYPQGTEIKQIQWVSATGGGFWSMETGKVDAKAVYGTFDVKHDLFPVPPGGRAVFEVAMQFEASIYDSGEVAYDFASDNAGYIVQCPYLLVTLLTSPGAGVVNG